jgi:hypothetical protein
LDLIITNGDAAGELLRRAIPRAEVLPWRDVLHGRCRRLARSPS